MTRQCEWRSACKGIWFWIYLISTDRLLPRNKPYQIILFSATFPDHVRMYADRFAPSANKIELQKNELSVDAIRQFYMDCRNEEHKYDILVSLYQLLTIGQSIIFTRVRCISDLGKICEWDSWFFLQYRHVADKIAARMTAEGHKVASLHGAKDAAERDAIIDNFREGRDKVRV